MLFIPKFFLNLSSRSFNNNVVCLGEQLIKVVLVLREILPIHFWMGADVDASPNNLVREFSSFNFKIIGEDQNLIDLAENTDQFLSGVFIAIEGNEITDIKSDAAGSTEDEPFRGLDLINVLIEIRAFDTTAFEIYSESLAIIEKLSSHFNEPIQTKK